MFLPDESYLRTAHEHDPSLQEYAWSSNVILASPSTLMMLLRTVSMTWQQETIAESAREVSDLGRELYKRLSTMGAHFAKLGRRSTARSMRTTRRSARSSGRCSCRRGGSSSTGSPASSRPSSSRSSGRPALARRSRARRIPQQPSLEAVSAGADAA